jgi:hypothetical protein
MANLALWIARPSSAGFTVVIHAPEHSCGPLAQRVSTHSPLLCHPRHDPSQVTALDIDVAAQLHSGLVEIMTNERDSSLWTVARSALVVSDGPPWIDGRWLLTGGFLVRIQAEEPSFQSLSAIGFLHHSPDEMYGSRPDGCERFRSTKRPFDFGGRDLPLCDRSQNCIRDTADPRPTETLRAAAGPSTRPWDAW